jgi:hypothetical protein
VQLEQFAQGDPLECTEAPGVVIMKKRFGFLAAEAPDHTSMILRDTSYFKQNTTWRARNKVLGPRSGLAALLHRA